MLHIQWEMELREEIKIIKDRLDKLKLMLMKLASK